MINKTIAILLLLLLTSCYGRGDEPCPNKYTENECLRMRGYI